MRGDLIDVLIEDHDRLRELFAELEDPHLLPERSWELASVAVATLVRHSVAEEAYLFPTARETLPEAGTLIDRELSDHHRIKEIMRRLEETPVEETAFFQIVNELIDVVRRHIDQEEATVFPQLRLASDPDELVRRGGRAQTLEQVGPTHPRDGVLDKPPWNALLAPGEGLIDRIQDAFARRPHDLDDLTPEPDLESIRRQRG